MRRGLVVLLALVLCAAAAAAPTRPHVTVITDSVAGSLGWDGTAARLFERGLDADLELGSCRRLATESCPAGDTIPENALHLIRRLGRRLGPNVVIAVGYNDFPTVYAAGIEPVLRALRAAGVERVFWVTLRATGVPYEESNGAIYGAARRHPEVTVVDWNRCSAGHPDWFGEDGVHVTGAGAQGLARCIHDAVLHVLSAPPPLEVELAFPPGLTSGFHASLRATGGRAPYRYSVAGLPAGLHARGDAIAGTLRRPGRYVLRVRVRDAAGRVATARVPLSVT